MLRIVWINRNCQVTTDPVLTKRQRGVDGWNGPVRGEHVDVRCDLLTVAAWSDRGKVVSSPIVGTDHHNLCVETGPVRIAVDHAIPTDERCISSVAING